MLGNNNDKWDFYVINREYLYSYSGVELEYLRRALMIPWHYAQQTEQTSFLT